MSKLVDSENRTVLVDRQDVMPEVNGVLANMGTFSDTGGRLLQESSYV